MKCYNYLLILFLINKLSCNSCEDILSKNCNTVCSLIPCIEHTNKQMQLERKKRDNQGQATETVNFDLGRLFGKDEAKVDCVFKYPPKTKKLLPFFVQKVYFTILNKKPIPIFPLIDTQHQVNHNLPGLSLIKPKEGELLDNFLFPGVDTDEPRIYGPSKNIGPEIVPHHRILHTLHKRSLSDAGRRPAIQNSHIRLLGKRDDKELPKIPSEEKPKQQPDDSKKQTSTEEILYNEKEDGDQDKDKIEDKDKEKGEDKEKESDKDKNKVNEKSKDNDEDKDKGEIEDKTENKEKGEIKDNTENKDKDYENEEDKEQANLEDIDDMYNANDKEIYIDEYKDDDKEEDNKESRSTKNPEPNDKNISNKHRFTSWEGQYYRNFMWNFENDGSHVNLYSEAPRFLPTEKPEDDTTTTPAEVKTTEAAVKITETEVLATDIVKPIEHEINSPAAVDVKPTEKAVENPIPAAT